MQGALRTAQNESEKRTIKIRPCHAGSTDDHEDVPGEAMLTSALAAIFFRQPSA